MPKKSIPKCLDSVYEHVNTWIIENYLSYFCKNKDCLVSSLFSDEIVLQIKLFPRGALSNCLDFISCFLAIKSVGEIELDCKLEMTDNEGNVFVAKKFRVKSRERKWDIGFEKFISIDEVLTKMAKSNSDSLIINCHMNKIQSETYSLIGDYVARTIIGVERFSFIWYLENLDTNLSQKTPIFFPKSSEMDFTLTTNETHVTITIKNSDFFDDIYRMEKEQDDVGRFNHQEDRFLLCKISFLNIKGKKLLTQQSYIEFKYYKEHYTQCCYEFKKDLFKVDTSREKFSLKCEICLSYGTNIKHIDSKEI